MLIFLFNVLQEILEGVTDIDLVINLKLREEALLAKCLGRRICSECGGNYNVASIDIKGKDGNPDLYMAPLLPPPHCASKLITRSDDTEEVVKKRLRLYNEMVFEISPASWNSFSSILLRQHLLPFLLNLKTQLVCCQLWYTLVKHCHRICALT